MGAGGLGPGLPQCSLPIYLFIYLSSLASSPEEARPGVLLVLAVCFSLLASIVICLFAD